MSIALYEICNNGERLFNPYCWRIRGSLVLLSIEINTITAADTWRRQSD